MDAIYIGIGLAFFAVSWALVRFFSYLQGGK